MKRYIRNTSIQYFNIHFPFAKTRHGQRNSLKRLSLRLKNIGTFRGECRLSVWLCQIAKNTFYTEVKRQQRQADYPLDTIPVTENIEQQLLNKETAFELHRLLHRLDDPYKEVFWMRTFGELSFAEIGSLFGKSESWARVTYHRAKLKIKEGIK